MAVPMSVAVEKSFNVFHLYPDAVVTVFQCQVIAFCVAKWVAAEGAAGVMDKVESARVTGTECPQPPIAHA